MMLLADPYALLHTEPVRRFAFIIVPEGSRVNLGLLYVRGAEADARGGAASVLWDVVRRLRLFVEDWTLRNPRSGKPNMQGLWDQGIFTDALASAVLGRHVYPYTYVQSPNIGAWRQIGWPPPNTTSRELARLHELKWHTAAGGFALQHEQLRPQHMLPPDGHGQRRHWERHPQALMWRRLAPLSPIAHLSNGALGPLAPGWLDPAALPHAPNSPRPGEAAAAAAAPEEPAGWREAQPGDELLLATPDWLYALVGRWAVTAGWAASSPPICAVVHLVECRSAFGRWNVAGRASIRAARSALAEPSRRALSDFCPPAVAGLEIESPLRDARIWAVARGGEPHDAFRRARSRRATACSRVARDGRAQRSRRATERAAGSRADCGGEQPHARDPARAVRLALACEKRRGARGRRRRLRLAAARRRRAPRVPPRARRPALRRAACAPCVGRIRIEPRGPRRRGRGGNCRSSL